MVDEKRRDMKIGDIVYCPMLSSDKVRKVIGFDKYALPITIEISLEEVHREIKKLKSARNGLKEC